MSVSLEMNTKAAETTRLRCNAKDGMVDDTSSKGSDPFHCGTSKIVFSSDKISIDLQHYAAEQMISS